MVLFRRIEGVGGGYLSDDRVIEGVGPLEVLDDGFGLGLLLGRMIEDRRAVLGALVRALGIEGGRVVEREKELQELPIRE